mmetsp:Transcript_956/g.4049  ORF Transcript_956/g.4049 Transcript_956/m.4049 type:complete len:266 (-) Transcript_956:908-1705(-)
MNNLRSSSSRSKPAPSTRICSCTGHVIFASGPTTELSTGTARQPSTLRPSATQLASRIFFASAALAPSVGNITIPTAEEPSENPLIPFAAHHLSKSFHGMCVMTPTPSPESLSAEHAPRCSMHPTAIKESFTVLCVRSPFNEAMKPTPHASCSSKSCVLSTAPPSYTGQSPYTDPRSAKHTVFARSRPGTRTVEHLGNAAGLRNVTGDGVNFAWFPNARIVPALALATFLLRIACACAPFFAPTRARWRRARAGRCARDARERCG